MGTDKKKKIVFINWNVENGSIPSIMKSIDEALSDAYDFFYFYQVGPKSHDRFFRITPWRITQGYYILAHLTGIKYGLGKIPTRRVLKYITKLKPNLIHIHCPNFFTVDIYYLFQQLQEMRLPVIVTNHAEFFYTGNCSYSLNCKQYLTGCRQCTRQFDSYHRYWFNRATYEWGKMRATFEAGNVIHTAVSPWQFQRMKEAPITRNCPIHLIENAIDTSVFSFSAGESLEEGTSHVLEIFKNQDPKQRTILHVTTFFSDHPDDLKGGCYVLKLAELMPTYRFLVAGSARVTHPENLPNNVNLLGAVKDKKELAAYYALADVTVLTSKRESYGLACAESLCCGTPVAGFEAGGTESIALPEFSRFVSWGDLEALQRAVIECEHIKNPMSETNAKGKSRSKEISAAAAERYCLKRMTDEYKSLYESVLEK